MQLLVSTEKVDPIKEHLQLLAAKFFCCLFGLGPGEAVLLQLLLPEAEPVSVPVQGFQVPALLVRAC